MLWNQKLEPLAATGVLLVDLTQNPESASGDWLPTPEVNLNLSSEYDEDARANAIDDLASFLLVNRLEASEIEAKTYSRSMLDSHCGPAALYGQLAAYLAKRLSS